MDFFNILLDPPHGTGRRRAPFTPPDRSMYQGFVEETVVVEETQVALNRAGYGPAVLLLHGYPETRVAWHRVAPELAARFSVVVPDLPGYGDSSEPRASPIEPFSKRNVARILVSLMRALGHQRFAVAGHDRGGRVAYRMALDNPEAVVRLALLDVVSTLDMAERLTYDMAWQMGNWFFLSQPAPVPETLIGGAPDFYLDKILDRWLGTPNALTPQARDEYRRCFRKPEVIRAACEDYRAGFGADLEHDRADRATGSRIGCPVLVLWARNGLTGKFFDPTSVWRRWADNISGRALPCGHFLMEEAPAEVTTALRSFFAPSSPELTRTV